MCLRIYWKHHFYDNQNFLFIFCFLRMHSKMHRLVRLCLHNVYRVEHKGIKEIILQHSQCWSFDVINIYLLEMQDRIVCVVLQPGDKSPYALALLRFYVIILCDCGLQFWFPLFVTIYNFLAGYKDCQYLFLLWETTLSQEVCFLDYNCYLYNDVLTWYLLWFCIKLPSPKAWNSNLQGQLLSTLKLIRFSFTMVNTGPTFN